MKLLVLFTSLVVAISAASDQDLWAEFKNNHGKTYRSLREEKLRFNIFQEKLREIESHNAKYEKGEVSYFLGINQFSDMTSEEFASLLKGSSAAKPKFNAIPFEEEENSKDAIPDEINWVEKDVVLEVKNQGYCGACWAFSVVGSIESQNVIKNNVKIPLSEQQLVDCTRGWNNNACRGGRIENTFMYLKLHGITSEKLYPYTQMLGDCLEPESVVQITDYVSVGGNETSLQQAVGTAGPVSVTVQARLWQSYAGGIFDKPICDGSTMDHAVVVVGYGKADGLDNWLIKNSWGTSWGEKGYIRLIRNRNNQCGIANEGYYPKL